MNGFPREIVIDQRETTAIRRPGAIRGQQRHLAKEELETRKEGRKKRESEREGERHLPTFFRDCTYFLCTGGRSSASRE